MKYAVVIPARYQSSRFPGKPLALINGKAMIQHVWERCIEAVSPELVFVATDSPKIREAVEGFGGQVVMTSDTCMTGTDRLAEANQILDCDFLINVQGDEPMISPQDIQAVIDAYLEHPAQVINAMAPITSEEEFRSNSVPKVVKTTSNMLMYMSRAAVPTTKELSFKWGHKQVCIYAFSKEHLKFYASFDNKAPNEALEDIEILRFLEHDIKVRMVEVPASSVAVDFPEDIAKVESLLK